MRFKEKYRHQPSNEWAKTLLKTDVRDLLTREQKDTMLYWDRFDEGVFVGGHESGSQ
jgi:hypothetical protein